MLISAQAIVQEIYIYGTYIISEGQYIIPLEKYSCVTKCGLEYVVINSKMVLVELSSQPCAEPKDFATSLECSRTAAYQIQHHTSTSCDSTSQSKSHRAVCNIFSCYNTCEIFLVYYISQTTQTIKFPDLRQLSYSISQCVNI